MIDVMSAFNSAIASAQRNTRIKNFVIGVLSLIGLGVLWFAGIGFLSTIALTIVVFLIVAFGSVGKLVSSLVIATLTTTFLSDIQAFVYIYISGIRTEKLFTLIESTGLVKLTLILFLFTYTLSYITGCLNIFKINASTKVNNNTGE